MKSKKNLKIGFIVVGLIVFFAVLNFIGALAILNQPLNSLIAGSPDKRCNVDSDCILRDTICHTCDCGDAVNKNWYPFCPFLDTAKYLCKMCASPNYDFEIKCVENQCQRVWKDSYTLRQKELSCINSGGKIETSFCCGKPNPGETAQFVAIPTCPGSPIGACGCSRENSHEVRICDCGADKCFDGNQCISSK
jgi:hypothetical protein